MHICTIAANSIHIIQNITICMIAANQYHCLPFINGLCTINDASFHCGALA